MRTLYQDSGNMACNFKRSLIPLFSIAVNTRHMPISVQNPFNNLVYLVLGISDLKLSMHKSSCFKTIYIPG